MTGLFQECSRAIHLAVCDQSNEWMIETKSIPNRAVFYRYLQQFGGEMDPQLMDNVHESVKLPQTFSVKYLGKRQARGLWGIKYTRKPVDEMVALAKSLPAGQSLPFLNFRVDGRGVTVSERPDNLNKDFETDFYPVDIISYGVQVQFPIYSLIYLIYLFIFSPTLIESSSLCKCW